MQELAISKYMYIQHVYIFKKNESLHGWFFVFNAQNYIKFDPVKTSFTSTGRKPFFFL